MSTEHKTILGVKDRKAFKELTGERREKSICYWTWWVDYHKTELNEVKDRAEKIQLGKEALSALGVN